MSNRLFLLAPLVLLVLSVSACQSKPKPHVDKSVEYEDARSIPSLQVPK